MPRTFSYFAIIAHALRLFRRAGDVRLPVLKTHLSPVLALPVLALLASFLFFHRLADRDLWSSHEARAGQHAQSMLIDSQWGLPRLIDGKPELQKPPLYYWLVALTAQARGAAVDAWAVRLPAALAALACVLGVFGLLAALGRPLAGFLAAGMLATMCHFTWLARVGRIDMPLTLTVSLAVGCHYLANIGAASRWARFVGYVAIAAGVMLKGPIGAVLPALILATHALLERFLTWRAGDVSPPVNQPADADRGADVPRSPLWSLTWGIPLILLLTVPWFWWANHATGGAFVRVFFFKHNLERGFGGGDDGPMHARPWWSYAAYLAGDAFPWSLLLPIAAWYLLRRGRWREDAAARLSLVWLVSVFVLLSCFRFKRADYLLPAYPGLAILLGCVAERWQQALPQRRWLVNGFAAVLVSCLAGWWVYVEHILPPRDAAVEQESFARAVRQRVPAPGMVMFFRTEDHLLYFHLGRPIHTFLEWENLDVWAGRPGPHYVIMDPASAAEWPAHISAGRLEEVLRSPPGHRNPVVLLRTVSHEGWAQK